jgi:mono/diheme cytochrome c family protein
MSGCRRLAIVLASLAPAACADSRAAEPPRAQAAGTNTRQDSAARSDTLRGSARLVLHPEHLQPNLVRPVGLELRNPYEGQAAAVATGAKLFVGYNCVDCHGVDGSGAMGPSLADGRWHFGGSAGAVYESIAQGRPDGMPAWGSLLPPDQIWRLVSYVQSLEQGKNVTTENFTGGTIERSGH